MATSSLPRRHFLLHAGWLGLAAGVRPGGLSGAETVSSASLADPAYPRNDLERVQTVVGASHGNLAVVRELVTEQSALAKSSWDWGFADWETTLGAAAHTGRRAIAEFLVAHGARPTLYSATMMGHLGVVRGFLEANPELFRLPGPHGIPLLAHARFGGDEAEPVLDYLLDRFGEDHRAFGTPGTDEIQARYGGTYVFTGEPAFSLQVAVGGMQNQWLLVGADRPTSRVLEVEPDVYAPTGAPAVRLRFQVNEGRAEALTIHDGPLVATGQRATDG